MTVVLLLFTLQMLAFYALHCWATTSHCWATRLLYLVAQWATTFQSNLASPGNSFVYNTHHVEQLCCKTHHLEQIYRKTHHMEQLCCKTHHVEQLCCKHTMWNSFVVKHTIWNSFVVKHTIWNICVVDIPCGTVGVYLLITMELRRDISKKIMIYSI